MATMPETIINVVTLDGVKLSMSSGDTLAVMTDQHLTREQRAAIREGVAMSVPAGVKVMILEGGLKVATISSTQRA